MEFWAVEVQSGKPVTCDPGTQRYIHISQAALGDSKSGKGAPADSKSGKGNERVVLKVKAGDLEAVVGTLSYGKCDQIPLDLIFDKPFILSHSSPSTSIYFCGYKSETDNVTDESNDSDEDYTFDDSDEDHTSELPVEDDLNPLDALIKATGKSKSAKKSVKPEVVDTKPLKAPAGEKEQTPAVVGKQSTSKTKLESAKTEDDEDEDDDDDDDDDEDEDEDEDEESDDLDDLEDDDMLDVSDDDLGSEENDSDEDDSEEDEQPKSAGKKRPLPSAKNVTAEKKAKVSTPKEATGKHGKAPLTPTATPKAQQQQGSKKEASAKKTPAKENGVKAVTPSSGKKGQFICQPCSKNFQTEAALAMHNSAKHK